MPDAVDDIQLTDREMAIARKAAQMAVKEMTDEFYKGVGRTVVQRALIVIGPMVVGVGLAKGWIVFPPMEK